MLCLLVYPQCMLHLFNKYLLSKQINSSIRHTFLRPLDMNILEGTISSHGCLNSCSGLESNPCGWWHSETTFLFSWLSALPVPSF